MYTKEELESMDIPQLVGIADQLGIKVSPDDQLENVVYAILDKAAENSATAEDAPKRKRTRIAKKDTSKVYTVNGEDGENLDSKTNRTRKKVEAPSLFADMPEASVEELAQPVVAEEKPKKRGRKSKAEKEAEEAAMRAAKHHSQRQRISLCPNPQNLQLVQTKTKKRLQPTLLSSCARKWQQAMLHLSLMRQRLLNQIMQVP